MKTLENNHGGNWVDRLLNAWPFCLDPAYTPSIFAIAWDADGIYLPGSRSLFYNGAVMLRLTFPFGIWIHLKPVRDRRLQAGLGWKLNGRIALNPFALPVIAALWLTVGWSWWWLALLPFYRVQTDASAAAGAHENAPNLGQASGRARGTA